MNIKTTLNAYHFDVSKEEEAQAYKELCESLRAKGLKVFSTIQNPSSKEFRNFRDIVNSLDGGYVELETKHIFNNQWNSAPIPGQSENGLRLMDWAESIFPNKDIKEGYYLEQTPEMAELRRNTASCGYCGHQEPMQKGNVFCPVCLDSEYLKPEDLHLTRMMSVESKGNRKKLSDAERSHLMPLYVHAQTVASGSRAKAKKRKETPQHHRKN